MNARRMKLGIILGGAILAGAVLTAWTQVWFTIALDGGQSLAVAGDVAAPALSALALTGLILIGALSIAGPFFRIVLGVLESLIGATIAVSSFLAVGNPVSAAAPAISEATGVAGRESTAELVASVDASAWPLVSAIIGCLIVLLGIAIIVTSRRWPGASRKYQAVRMENPAGEQSSVDDWDALSDGTDPTSR